MDKSLELLKEAERMIYSLQDAYVSHSEADALRKRIRYHINAAQQSAQRTACHAADCDKLKDMFLICNCGFEQPSRR